MTIQKLHLARKCKDKVCMCVCGGVVVVVVEGILINGW